MLDTEPTLSLHERLARSRLSSPDPLHVRRPTAPQGALNVYTAEFFLPDWIVRADLTSSEARISDHLNSSLEHVDVRVTAVGPGGESGGFIFAQSSGYLAKDRILFVIPLVEPPRAAGIENAAWVPTIQRRCWIGLAACRLVGTIHTEAGRDPQVALRQHAKQFIPLTDVSLTLPDGSTRTCDAVILNRERIDVVAMDGAARP